MAAFDRLPRSVRHALAGARYSWPVKEIAAHLAAGESASDVCEMIRSIDADLAAQRRRA
jgi:hypothetical protein